MSVHGTKQRLILSWLVVPVLATGLVACGSDAKKKPVGHVGEDPDASDFVKPSPGTGGRTGNGGTSGGQGGMAAGQGGMAMMGMGGKGMGGAGMGGMGMGGMAMGMGGNVVRLDAGGGDRPRPGDAGDGPRLGDARPGDAPKADMAAPKDTAPLAALTVTSSAFTNNGTIPDSYTCGFADGSPPLAWTAGPAGTKGYAVVLTGVTSMRAHWILWDLPSDTTSIAAGVPEVANLTTPAALNGAKQNQYNAATDKYGYNGPCPNGALHDYEFVVYALGAKPLAAATPTTPEADLLDAIKGQALAMGKIVFKSMAARADGGVADAATGN